MPVREHNPADTFAVLLQVGHIGYDQIYPEHLLVGEHQP